MGAKDLMRMSHISGKAPVQMKKEEVKEEQSTPNKTSLPENDANLPTAIRQVKRPDVSVEEYGVKPDITNFQLYNYELSEFLSSFSRQNKKNGGNPITKSQFMETVLGFVYYDMKVRPDGFESTQDLLSYLQKQLGK